MSSRSLPSVDFESAEGLVFVRIYCLILSLTILVSAGKAIGTYFSLYHLLKAATGLIFRKTISTGVTTLASTMRSVSESIICIEAF